MDVETAHEILARGTNTGKVEFEVGENIAVPATAGSGHAPLPVIEGIKIATETDDVDLELGKENIRTSVRMAGGAFSVCWDGGPNGVFKDQQALSVADQLEKRIRDHVSTTLFYYSEWLDSQKLIRGEEESKDYRPHDQLVDQFLKEQEEAV